MLYNQKHIAFFTKHFDPDFDTPFLIILFLKLILIKLDIHLWLYCILVSNFSFEIYLGTFANYSYTNLLVVLEKPLVKWTIPKPHNSYAIFFAKHKLSFIKISIPIIVCSLSMNLVIIKLPYINVAILKLKNSFSSFFSINKVSFVDPLLICVFEDLYTKAICQIVL